MKEFTKTYIESSEIYHEDAPSNPEKIIRIYIKDNILSHVQENPPEFIPRCISSALSVISSEENAIGFCLLLLEILARDYEVATALLINENAAIFYGFNNLLYLLIDLLLCSFGDENVA